MTHTHTEIDLSTPQARTGYLAKAASAAATHDGLFVMNEESEDRIGDTIVATGWDLKNFRKNPIALYGHSHDIDNVIGTWERVRVEGNQLLGELHLAGTRVAQTVRQLIQEGVLRAVSVGFRIREYVPVDEREPWGAWRITKAELLETSVVAVPAHPSALLVAKRMGLTLDERRLLFPRTAVSAAESPAVHRGVGVSADEPPHLIRARAALDLARKTLGK